MIQYLDLLRHVMEHGNFKADRTGTGTYSVFGARARFPLQHSFPVVTTKKLPLRSISYELLWFARGETNVRYLQENKVTIWDEWADEHGDLGPVYGNQWRYWVKSSRPRRGQCLAAVQPTLFDLRENGHGRRLKPDAPRLRKSQWGIDQIAEVIREIKTNPDRRRLVVNAWNVSDIDSMALPPCHTIFQFYVSEGELSCQHYQRSADIFLGVPFFSHVNKCYLSLKMFTHNMISASAHLIVLSPLVKVGTESGREVQLGGFHLN